MVGVRRLRELEDLVGRSNSNINTTIWSRIISLSIFSGDPGAARAPISRLVAWKEALKLGLTKDSIGRIERKRFDEVKSRIDELQTTRQTASLGLGDPEQLDAGVLAMQMPAMATR